MIKVFVTLLLLINFKLITAQSFSSDIELLKNHKPDNADFCSAKYKRITDIPLLIYKRIFSEQISADCEFDLSCSSFSLEAFRQFNFIKAYFLTADRLTRCGVSYSEVPYFLINPINAKVIDLPDFYIWNR